LIGWIMTIFGAQGVPDAIEEQLSCAILKSAQSI
jgi:hypothetical protein